MIQRMSETNYVTLVLSITSIALLLVCKCVVQPWLSRRFPKRMVAVPWEFILVCFLCESFVNVKIKRENDISNLIQ
jgi:hypothetical protein